MCNVVINSHREDRYLYRNVHYSRNHENIDATATII